METGINPGIVFILTVALVIFVVAGIARALIIGGKHKRGVHLTDLKRGTEARQPESMAGSWIADGTDSPENARLRETQIKDEEAKRSA